MSNFPAGFEPHHRFDFFEPEDKTALLCLDVPEMQRLAIEQLDALGYKVHTALFLDDSLLKLSTHPYDVILLSEHFAGSALNKHPLLAELARLPSAQRRKQTVVLLGANFTTNDELQAFAHNVDLVVSLVDLINLKPVLRRTVARAAELNAPLHEVLATLAAEERNGLRPEGW
jgi:CheY-like chemotaxis protein